VFSLFQNYELTVLVWTITFFISIKQKYSVTILTYVSIFLAILFISFLPTIFVYSHRIFPIIRDFTYIVKPILGLLVGYQLYRYHSSKGFRILVYAGFTIALIHIGLLIFAFLTYKSLDLNLIRSKGGFFSDYEIYILILLLFHKKFQLTFSKKEILLYTTVIGFSSLTYFARTNMIQFLILFLAMKGYLLLNKATIKVLSILIITTLISYSFIYSYNPKRTGDGMNKLLYKIKIAPEEAFKTRINKEDWKDFNDNYRSFENIIAVKQVSSNGIGAILFGEGLGSTLNLGRRIHTTDGSEVQYIPIAHNGFMTVFLKSGVVGVIFLIVFIIFLYRQPKSNIPLVENVNLLLIGSSIFLIVSNWVFMGFYLKLDNKSIIIGFLIALREMLLKENKALENKLEDSFQK
jgi:hypothetical protein